VETYDANATKPLFLKTLSTKVDLHEASRNDCDLYPKELDIDLIMQKCLDDVLKITNPRPINISGKGSISSNLLERTLERLDKFSVVYVFM